MMKNVYIHINIFNYLIPFLIVPYINCYIILIFVKFLYILIYTRINNTFYFLHLVMTKEKIYF